MSDDARSIADEKPKRDYRQEVTDNIVAMLERGTAPWQKPWDAQRGMEMPFNPTTENAYRGGNAVHLLATGVSRGYEDPRWMTYRQAQENGWQVRKGEKGTQIEFWQFRQRDGQEPNDQVKEGDEAQAKRGAPLHRIFTVFNAAQIDGIPAYEPKTRAEWEVVKSAENIMAGAGVRILHDQADRAYYTLGKDEVHLPPREAFPTPAHYYGTVLHELGHATGHPDRLDRDTLTKSAGFGSTEYAKEELRAELTSMMLAAERGIPHDPEQHAAYVASWIKVLREDKNEIFRASKDAARATEYLLDRELERTEAEVEREEPQPGQQRGPDGNALPDVITRETSEHVASFDPDNGAVEITEKNTATTVRELFETRQQPGRDDSATASQEQILDNEVDGRRAPTGFDSGRTETSLAQAKALVERELGQGSRTMNALTDSGRYDGPLIGMTDEHVVQGYTSKVAILHERANLRDEPHVDPNQHVLIEYNRGHASIRALERTTDREHQHEYAMERE